jgi:DNA-binding GntR family transcriptional regulator
LSDLSLRQKAYDHIHRKLLDGELRAGSLISEKLLADEIGISRTPLREAISQLQAEGVLQSAPRVGTRVRSPDRQDLRELYELREALESYAAAAAATRLASGELEMLDRLCQEIQAIGAATAARGLEFLDEPLLRRFLDADIGFHMIIVRCTNNHRCMRAIKEFRVIQRIFEYHRVVHGPRIVREAFVQHAGILEAIRQGEADRARLAMAEHIRSSARHALRSFDQRPGEENAAGALAPELPDDLLLHLRQFGDPGTLSTIPPAGLNIGIEQSPE